jgi:hypothetical protein
MAKTERPGVALAGEPMWSAPVAPPGPTVDPEAYALECVLRSLISLGAVTSPRSRQTAIGTSEIGHVCDRRIAYRLAGTPRSNLTDPLRALVGVGWHAAMAEVFGRLDGGLGRFLVEYPVSYRGIPGTLDLYDRASRTVIDWKTTLRSRVVATRHGGPPTPYVVQVQTYGAALESMGETPSHVALAYVPTDAELSGLWVWRTPYDRAVADAAIERLDRLRGRLPGATAPTPSETCGWCDNFRPHSTNLDLACPGQTMNEVRGNKDGSAVVASGPAESV